MWMGWCWVALAALLAVILPPSNATLSPAGINYEGTLPTLPFSSHRLRSLNKMPIFSYSGKEKKRHMA
jgi:hypothetical protein